MRKRNIKTEIWQQDNIHTQYKQICSLNKQLFRKINIQ